MDEGRWSKARRAASRASDAVRVANRREAAIDAVRRVRRALPGDPGFGDPLSAAGSDSAAVAARLADRLFAEEPRATHELALGALQVWHAALQRSGRGRLPGEVNVGEVAAAHERRHPPLSATFTTVECDAAHL